MSEPGAAPLPPLPPLPPPYGAKRVIGIIVMVLGIALTAASGLCTTVFMVDDMTSSGGGEINLSGVEFIVGGPFILIGALMWWGGARLKRRPPP